MCLCIFDFWNFVSRWFGAYGCLFSEINQFALSAYSVPLPAVLICTYCFWNWTVSLPPFKFLCWSWPHWLRDVARFEGGASKEGIPLKWAVRVGSNLLTTEAPVRGSWHTMIQDWGSQRGETIWKQHQGGLLRAKVRRLQKNQPCQQFDLGLAACGVWKQIPLLKPGRLQYCVTVAQAGQWRLGLGKSCREHSPELNMKRNMHSVEQKYTFADVEGERNPLFTITSMIWVHY